ncbi:MAG: adenylosuccinate synthase [archaeon]
MNLVVAGMQVGDEGKGKIVDYLAEKADYVVRYNGGGNAGHTIIADGKKTVLHYIPSGILRGKKCVIGNGVIVSLEKIKEEIEMLEKQGLNIKENLFISELAHIVLPEYMETSKTEKSESTGRGVSPTYQAKVAREGIRMYDIVNYQFLDQDNKRLKIKECIPYLKEHQWIKPFIINTVELLNDAIKNKKNILFEGAQGTTLCVDFGGYPYTTSSNPGAAGAPVGAGIGPHHIHKVLGVAKAYITRVDRTGASPLPTQIDDEVGDMIRKKGDEFGATTGRPRRCGWFDVPILRHSLMVNGVHSLILTKLDVLDGLEEVKLCVSYDINGTTFEKAPADGLMMQMAKPIYEAMPGWKESTVGVKSFDDLPENAKKYVRRIEELADIKCSIVCNGPERNSIIILEDPWK